MENNKNSEETLSSKTTGKGESEDTLTNRQAIRSLTTRMSGQSAIEDERHWRIMIFGENQPL